MGWLYVNTCLVFLYIAWHDYYIYDNFASIISFDYFFFQTLEFLDLFFLYIYLFLELSLEYLRLLMIISSFMLLLSPH